MATAAHLRGLRESVWLEQAKYEQAEGKYHEVLARSRGRLGCQGAALRSGSSGVIEATMTMIQQSLSANPETGHRADLEKRVVAVENENAQLRKELVDLKGRVAALEGRLGAPVTDESQKTADEEDFDLFGDEGDEEEEKVVPQPKPAKPKKPPVVAKSTIVLDVKPWDTETDMKEVEQLVRGITTDGLLWGASKLVDVAFGIKKLQIACVVEDEKVGIDFLEESITAFEDHVQSVDVVAFNKI